MQPDSEEVRFGAAVHAIVWRRYAIPLLLVGTATLLWIFGNPEFNIVAGLAIYFAAGVWVSVLIRRRLKGREAAWGDESIDRQELELSTGIRGGSPVGVLIVSLLLLFRTVRDALRKR